MSNKIKGAFTVRFIRTGDQIYVTKNIVKFDKNGAESGGSLFQAIDPTSGTLSVDWKTDIYNQPALKIGIKSAVGNPVTITSIKWTYRGTELTFNTSAATTGNYTGWQLSTDGKFAKKEVDGFCYLRLIDNAASTTVISNQIIGYEISYISNNVRDSIGGTEDVLIQQAGADSYSINITTSCSTLNATQTSTTLTATYLYGVKPISDTEFAASWKLEWYKDFTIIAGQNGKTLNVTRDDVDGSSVFSVKLLHKEGDNWVVKAVDAQRVTDDADEWTIDAEPDGTNPDAISKTSNAKFVLKLKQNGTAYTGSVTWGWEVYNALNAKTATSTGANVTLTAEMAKCVPDASNPDKNYYSDVAVEVSAEIA
ncbi:hypothetical protein [Prevotella sp. 885]|uniref:hypothetical protein n=1 Tax=Prevotella sp. 885 TaxID=2022527 RepID=UPI000BA00C44|nr:hypothetical protein [Prevotella sp. 885]OZT04958.1 hypothetical protein CHL74_01860 [Prevotella sp. 885]